jgi:hypothetical protein
MRKVTIDQIELSYLGPPLSAGPLPTIFYFALSADDTLLQDPYNQPISGLDLEKVRVFSCDLPEHEPPKSPYDAIKHWIEKLDSGSNFFETFLLRLKSSIDHLLANHSILINQLGFMGLSRGAFIACHIASYFEAPLPIVGFSPLTKLSQVKEAKELSYHLNHLDLFQLIDRLYNKQIQFYIGNKDSRVDSNLCAKLILDLAEKAFERGIKTPPIELKIFPSIGYMGHGTPKTIFIEGSRCLFSKIYHE